MDVAPCLLFLLFSFFFFFFNVSSSAPRSYIIQVEEPIGSLTEASLMSWYKSFLPPDTDDLSADKRLLHSYREVFSGFAARLTEEEVQAVEKKEGFVNAFPDRVLHVLTTHTPKFLGLELGKKGLWNDSRLGSGVIIGVLDTGVTPGHPSFDDEGVPPPPSRWKGSCDLQTGCNNKLIGAKSFIAGEVGRPPIDIAGHGTHTSSTAAGNFVRNVSFYGLAEGTASGTAPRAHLAIYQVCQGDGTCSSSDILAGLDAAVKDGVDVLSISLGAPSTPLDRDPIAIGTFAAVKKGIFVSCAAGNSGPSYYSLSNEAPWILTVAASSVDRSLRASVKLGNGKVVSGESLDQSQNFTNRSLALYHPKEAPSCESKPSGGGYRGKVWVCNSGNSSPREVASFIKSLGARALILIATDAVGSTILDSRCNFPTILVTSRVGSIIKSYLNASRKQPAAASIAFDGTVLGVSPAPVVAFFSSRGPSLATPGIIKPDIAGPGLNILAAWIPDSPEAGNNGKYTIISGTSMATPHLSGISALIKALHPTWSPAAIKSAIVTTADVDVVDEQLEPAIYYAKGAGHVNPAKAVDPGLVYDVDADDYLSYICGKFGDSGARAIVRGSTDCSGIKNVTEAQLNYPSILLVPGDGGAATVRRTVTNVGSARSSYKVSLTSPETVVKVSVTPKTLTFTKLKQKKSFSVTAKWVNGKPTSGSIFYEGTMTWTSDDGRYVVRSPIVVPAIQ